MRGRSRRRTPSDASRQPRQAGDRQEHISLQLIASKLERLTWRRRVWGADERQVWHVIQRMDEMYRQLYREQEVRYQALLSQAQASSTLTGQVPAAAVPSEGLPASASVPLQAVPASRPPARYRGETVSSRSPAAPQPQLQPLPSQAPGETRAMPRQAARHLAPPTPGSSPSGASWR